MSVDGRIQYQSFRRRSSGTLRDAPMVATTVVNVWTCSSYRLMSSASIVLVHARRQRPLRSAWILVGSLRGRPIVWTSTDSEQPRWISETAPRLTRPRLPSCCGLPPSRTAFPPPPPPPDCLPRVRVRGVEFRSRAGERLAFARGSHRADDAPRAALWQLGARRFFFEYAGDRCNLSTA